MHALADNEVALIVDMIARVSVTISRKGKKKKKVREDERRICVGICTVKRQKGK
jgi:hypothetical protein